MKYRSLRYPVIAIGVAALMLFGAVSALGDIGAEKAETERLEMMRTLLPGSTDFAEEAVDPENEAIDWAYKAHNGYVIQTTTQGYAGDVVLMVGVNNAGMVTGITVRDLSETYGLGFEALTDAQFLSQLVYTEGKAEVGADVDAVTGATVTSKAIVRGINAAVGFVTGADTSSGATSWGG